MRRSNNKCSTISSRQADPGGPPSMGRLCEERFTGHERPALFIGQETGQIEFLADQVKRSAPPFSVCWQRPSPRELMALTAQVERVPEERVRRDGSPQKPFALLSMGGSPMNL